MIYKTAYNVPWNCVGGLDIWRNVGTDKVDLSQLYDFNLAFK